MKIPNPFRFLASMWGSFQRWRRGERVIAPSEAQEERRGKCQVCPHRIGAQCGLCLCFVELKVLFAGESCPDKPKRWQKI